MKHSAAMNKLQAYAGLHEVDDEAAAKALGITRAAFVNLRTGNRKPSLAMAFKIETWSGGSVPASSWHDAGVAA